MAPNNLSPKQLQALGYIFDAVARLLPTEGRDFLTKVNFPEGGAQPRVMVIGMTPLGKVFAEHCMHNIGAATQEILRQEGMQDKLPLGTELKPTKEQDAKRPIELPDLSQATKLSRNEVLSRLKIKPNIGIGPTAPSQSCSAKPQSVPAPVPRTQRVL